MLRRTDTSYLDRTDEKSWGKWTRFTKTMSYLSNADEYELCIISDIPNKVYYLPACFRSDICNNCKLRNPGDNLLELIHYRCNNRRNVDDEKGN